jgi:putative transposase
MKLIHKGYKYRIYPNKEQTELLNKHFGSCRFVFNYFLNLKINTYKQEKKNLNNNYLSSLLTLLKKEQNYSWLNEINSQSLQASLKNVDIAYDRFFKRINQYPKFKSKNDKQSFKVIQNLTIENNLLYLPKFKKGIKINIDRDFKGKILYGTVSKTPTGKYYVSITCKQEYIPFEKTGSIIGIDTGIKDLATLSDKTIYENKKVLKKRLKKIKYKQRQLSKKVKGSKSRIKQRNKLAIEHEKVVNIRKDYLHKVSTEIIKNHDIICIEDLSIKNMMKNHNLAQAFSDVSLGTFYDMLEYKASFNEKEIIKIGRFFASSKTCSKCNYINEELTLKDREWTCKGCGTLHDRDYNASINIKNEGLKILSGLGCKSDIKQKVMEAFPLGESMKSYI